MTATTAAELRAEVLVRMGPGWQSPSDDLLSDLLAAARAEAVAEYRDVLRQLMEAMPRCESMARSCPNPATRYQPYEATCDDHGGGDDTGLAAPLRLALKLLAADQSKAGKP